MILSLEKVATGKDRRIYTNVLFTILIIVWLRHIALQFRIKMDEDFTSAWKAYLNLCKKAEN